MHGLTCVKKYRDGDKAGHNAKPTPEWLAWCEWYRNNKIFYYHPDTMTVPSIWPPMTEMEVEEYVQLLVQVKTTDDDIRRGVKQEDLRLKYAPNPHPRPYHRYNKFEEAAE